MRIGPLRLHTVELASLDVFAVVLAVASYIALTRLRWPLLLTIAASAAAGFLYFVISAPRP